MENVSSSRKMDDKESNVGGCQRSRNTSSARTLFEQESKLSREREICEKEVCKELERLSDHEKN